MVKSYSMQEIIDYLKEKSEGHPSIESFVIATVKYLEAVNTIFLGKEEKEALLNEALSAAKDSVIETDDPFRNLINPESLVEIIEEALQSL